MRFVRWLFVHFNHDPHLQYRIHLVGTVFWLINIVGVVALYYLAPHFWASFSVFYLAEITFYGNFATDYCGVSDAEASGHTAALRALPSAALHHRALGALLSKMSVDAHFQYRLHLALTYNWVLQGVAAGVIYVVDLPFWQTPLALLYVLILNVYTALATDYSALPGALAAYNAQQLRQGRSPWERNP